VGVVAIKQKMGQKLKDDQRAVAKQTAVSAAKMANDQDN
jgi:hypothetical protein